jgi:hypothetical protein
MRTEISPWNIADSLDPSLREYKCVRVLFCKEAQSRYDSVIKGLIVGDHAYSKGITYNPTQAPKIGLSNLCAG